MSFELSLFIYLGLSATTAFVFWSSLMKAVRLVGTEKEQGFMYGLYYACNGLTSAFMNAFALTAYGTAGGDVVDGFVRAVIAGGSIAVISAIALMILMKSPKGEEDTSLSDDETKFKLKDVGKVLKNPVVWVVSLTILCGYGIFSSTSYFNPYLTEVVGVTPESSGAITIVRNYLLLLLAPVGGIIADKLLKSTCKWLTIAFSILAVLFAIVLIMPSTISPLFASLYTLLPGAFAMMMYGVIFSTVSEAKIPRAFTGTVIGIASIIGYMPDSIYSLLFGNWLDAHGGAGYNYIFLFLAASAALGAVLSIVIYRIGHKKEMSENG